MSRKSLVSTLLGVGLLLASSLAQAEEIYRLRLFFGLSIPGGGAVSLADWESFQNETLATTFDGFNVVDSLGYYKGKPERSKVVTLIVSEDEIKRAKSVAAIYAKRFKQDSVMVVKVPVEEWSFVGAEDL